MDIRTPLVSPANLNLKWLLPLKLGGDEHVSLRYTTEMKLGEIFCTAMEILENSKNFRALPKTDRFRIYNRNRDAGAGAYFYYWNKD